MTTVELKDLQTTVRLLENLPTLLEAKRRRLGLSLRDVARETGLSPATLCRLVAGREVGLETAVRVVKWMSWS